MLALTHALFANSLVTGCLVIFVKSLKYRTAVDDSLNPQVYSARAQEGPYEMERN